MSSSTLAHVLVVDDEKNIRATLAMCLGLMGCEVSTAATASGAVRLVQRAPFEIAFVDLRLDSDSGLELVPRLLAAQPALAIILMSAWASYETAVEAIRRGAIYCLPKPFTPAQVRHSVNFILDRRSLARSF